MQKVKKLTLLSVLIVKARSNFIVYSDKKGANFVCMYSSSLWDQCHLDIFYQLEKLVENFLNWLVIFVFSCCIRLNKILLLLQIKSMRILELHYRKTWPPLPLVSMCRLSGSPSQRSQKSSGRTTKPCKQLTMHILYKQGEKKSSFHHLNMKRGITLALVLIQSQ